MTELLTAITTFFSAGASGPLTSTITGGVHLMLAAKGTALPYCVMTPITAPLTSKYGGAAFSEPQIQFTVWGENAATTLALLNSATTGLMAKFDEKLFTLATGQCFQTLRLTDPIPLVDSPEDDETGTPVFGWTVTYAYATTR